MHITCACLRAEKIPAMELLFIMDQREKIGLRGGGMQIVKADKVEARRQEKEEERKSKKLKGGPTTTLSMSIPMSSEPVAEHNNNDCEM